MEKNFWIKAIKMLTWKTQKRIYSDIENAYHGKWKIGSIYYDGFTSMSGGKNWAANFFLPGVKIKTNHFRTAKEAKEAVLYAFKFWVKRSGFVLPIKRRKRTIGIIGTRRRDSERDFQIVRNEFIKHYHPGDRICSGLCPLGGDRFAVILAEEFGTPTLWFAADWDTHGKIAGFIRNTNIARESKIIIACVADDRKGGTEDTIKKFIGMGKKRGLYIV
jgi:hypothetical protein